MVSKIVLLSAVVAYVEARFGQEQVPIQAISDVQGGDPGAAATIAGAAISDLLGGANACAKLATADKIVAELGGGADAIAAAIGMVTAEKNTNPFNNGNVQNVCGDPTLPATAELRGITPLIDPDVDTDGGVAALSADSAANPLNADGLSVFDLLDQAGFGDLVQAQNADGAAAGGAAAGGNNNADQNQNAGNDNAGNADDAADADAGNDNADAGNNNADAGNDNAACDAGNANQNQNQNQNQNAGNGNQNQNQDNGNDNANQDNGNADAGADAGNNNNNNNNSTGNAGAGAGAGGAAGAGSVLTGDEDFGQCTPTIIFEAGVNNRAADEFTFQIGDELARGGQSEALNPNIITNALCDQLTNVCEANDAAVAACEQAQQLVEAAGTRDKSTADLFNTALGFDGAVTNPSGGPADPSELAAKKRGVVKRAFRA